MKVSNIYLLLNNKIEILDFKKYIYEEFIEYKNNIINRTLVINLNIDDDCEFIFTKINMITLCSYFKLGYIDNYELNFIVDTIELSEAIDYEIEELSDYIFLMANPEINGQFSIDIANNIINILQ
ncbi:MAG: hypothetical protein NTW25_16405 [Candidatus Kapabacteria bacterium]|nr:hypothetical protein [Candidatus Kapabacteria bacterium]